MNVFEKITQSPETLSAFLREISAIETPWDEAFHRMYCDKCPSTDCDYCPKEDKRNNPLWFLRLDAGRYKGGRSEEAETCELCRYYDFSRIGYDTVDGATKPKMFFSGGSSVAQKNARFSHCPACGKRLTAENFKYAEEVEKRGKE